MPRKPSYARASARPTPEAALRFSLGNWILLAAGLAAVVLGFVLLAQGSTAAAPLILMLGFLVLIPWGIIR
jgi:uncharacterized membrane protein HdeD (DUF308 family)